MTTDETRFRKASKSQNTDNCVELGHTLDVIRDSKNGETLTGNVSSLVATVKAGLLNR